MRPTNITHPRPFQTPTPQRYGLGMGPSRAVLPQTLVWIFVLMPIWCAWSQENEPGTAHAITAPLTSSSSRTTAGDQPHTPSGGRVSTLSEALAQAYDAAIDLQAQEAATRATDEEIVQAQAIYRPTVQGTAGYSHTKGSTRGGTATPHQRQATAGVSMTQPLLNFTYFPKLDQAEADVAASRANLLKTEQTMLQNAIKAYMDVWRDANILQKRKLNETFHEEIMDFAEIRYKVGDTSITDLTEAKAKLAEARSTRISAENALAISQATYQHIMSVDKVPVLAPVSPPAIPDTLEEVIAAAKAHSPDVMAALASLQRAEASIRVQERSFFPTVNLTASAGRTNSFGSTGARSDSTTLGANLTLPLDVSGVLQSNLRQSHDSYVKSKLELDLAVRNITIAATQAWHEYHEAVTSAQERETHVVASQTTVDSMRLEHQLGGRSQSDLLVAQSNLTNAEVALERSQAAIITSAYKVLAVMGRLTAQHLNLNVTPYNPDVHYKEVDGKWWGLGSALDDLPSVTPTTA